MLKLVETLDEANCVTHSGTMHADEVFATAFLELYLKDIKLKRTSTIEPDDYEDKIIYDIGRKTFDHHQEAAAKRPNGITYSSFGLLWRHFGKSFLIQENIENYEDVFTEIDKDLIEAIDAIDNGEFPKIEANYRVKTLSDTFKLFNPSYNSGEKEADQFIKAEYFAKILLQEEILNISGKVQSRNIVTELIENNPHEDYLVLENFMPYEEALQKADPLKKLMFIIFPSNRGGFTVKAISKSFEDKTNRMNFPSEWGGLMDEELEKVSKIKGLTFCHNKLFICNCNTMKQAEEVAKQAIRYNKENSKENN